MTKIEADVCLVLEGTYPYVMGGVSKMTHDLIVAQQHLKFSILTLLAPNSKRELKYQLPENVIDLKVIELQNIKPESEALSKNKRKKFFDQIKTPILNLQSNATLTDVETIIRLVQQVQNRLGPKTLLNSQEAWEFMTMVYEKMLSKNCFLDYFWSWRSLFGGFFSMFLTDIPKARCYHSQCTGYAGLFLARVHVETGKPCLLTEHGIYTNERRIEIGSADWLNDQHSLNLIVDEGGLDKNLRNYWIDNFIGYSKLCYQACERIVTLYEGNQILQIADGAEKEKLQVIPNGIDYDTFSRIERHEGHPPTIALIGRVVPIKDIKTFIRACIQLRNSVPEVRVWIMGPTDEDEDYYRECAEMVDLAEANENIQFTGKVNIKEYLPEVDIMALTSISEGQPLVILEAGAAGIPTVTTNVGACKEMIFGRSDEKPNLGPGGEVCSLASPYEIAIAMRRLIEDKGFYAQCCEAIQKRVKLYYNKPQENESYRKLYELFINDDAKEM